MRITLGIVCVVVGSWAWIGQLITSFDYRLAGKLKLQDPVETIDPIYQRAETYTARWDVFILWTLLATGILLLVNHPWWPYLGLITAGIHLDASREIAKYKTFKAEGIRIGTETYQKYAIGTFVMLTAISIWLIIYAISTLSR